MIDPNATYRKETVKKGFFQHEMIMNTAAAKRRSSISTGNIAAHNEDLGAYVSSFLYESIMDVFVVGRTQARVAIFEDISYLGYKLDNHVLLSTKRALKCST